MEPVPVTRTVRRTVRMAVALVVGQALLCALIGWLTLGQSRSEPPGTPGSVVDQLAAPPPANPPPPSARTAIAPATTQARKPAPVATTTRPVPRRAVTSSAVPSRPPAQPPASREPEPILIPAPKSPAPEPPAPSPPAVTPMPTTTSATPAPSPTPDLVREPVEVGDECRPAGAYGRTAEGVLVRCVREWGHRPRWKIV
ncbi:hypothetical protein OWR29_20740 [Actinoplanes sp. Pm04-4]|uniref:Uncharacterized protein n=1 Tax=Paractinoplanes pyxinae TaxID=2997416 RepID=A0ABT4B1P7_9ACTN|nr:hypothetical protein [Actinoplanes pyxinae]MCY1140432.1 hypothetical protein [Actinoplanes pyxinae]